MNRRVIISQLLLLVCFLMLLPISAYAQSAPSFLLTAANPVDGKVTITMNGNNMNDLYGYEASLAFDSGMLELVEAKSGLEGFSVSPVVKGNEIVLAHTKIGNVAGENGDLLIGTLTFKIRKYGASTVTWKAFKTIDSRLAAQTYAIDESVSVVAARKFVDLEGHWAREDIELLAAKGVIEGMDEDHFVPEAHVTRAQFTALLARALHIQTDAKQNPFTDVSPGSWYNEAVRSAFAAGVIQGVTETSFAPEQKIAREDMAVMMARASAYVAGAATGQSLEGDLPIFADMEEASEWARADIRAAVHLGIINGREENRFVPKDKATRAEAAVVIKRLLSSLSLL